MIIQRQKLVPNCKETLTQEKRIKSVQYCLTFHLLWAYKIIIPVVMAN